ncbi:MAG: peptide chain release factor N(5)-glutamine methyltransferase [Anaerolineales bacterium]|nr:peptide chain release factor N(5)-glutamine methyltransferase [Anaerolineales bacterium]
MKTFSPLAIRSVLEQAARRLRQISDTPELDAQVVLAKLLGKSRSWLAAHLDSHLDSQTLASLESALQRLEAGEPLPYVLGSWEFYRLVFEVTPDVLIPRPETELLVERAIAWLRQRLERLEKNKEHLVSRFSLRVLDVGTGSGCIAIALAVNLPQITVVATDISAPALAVAQRNAERFKVADRITFLEADLAPEYLETSPFDLIVANLPYIPTQRLHQLPIYGREPTLALDGGEDGLTLIRRLLQRSPRLLSPGGRMILEIDASQGLAALSIAYDVFEQAEIHLYQDLAGHDRLLEIQR